MRQITRSDSLLRALRAARPGERLRVAPGTYPGGLFVENVRGAAGKPIIVEAADPSRPPVFRGGSNGMQLSGVAHIELRGLHFLGARGNGLNLDDGGRFGASHHIVLRDLRVGEMEVRGNFDGIKLSGITDFSVAGCTVVNWGVGGQGIDMVGCHRGVVEGCTLRHTDEERSAGVQMKGGTADVTVRRCKLESAGGRALNVGGSTGLEFFRPRLDLAPGSPRNAEARNITVEGCTIEGGQAALAFVGVDGAKVRFNTIRSPRRWAIRILQETRHPSFLPCRGVVFEGNLVVFSSENWASGGVNVGDGTAPETFRFLRNAWLCTDAPTRCRPQLPTPETGGVYGVPLEKLEKRFGTDALPHR